jgi:hypothetical protein
MKRRAGWGGLPLLTLILIRELGISNVKACRTFVANRNRDRSPIPAYKSKKRKFEDTDSHTSKDIHQTAAISGLGGWVGRERGEAHIAN